MLEPLFPDRADAGRRLAKRLTAYAGRTDVLILGLPRGGVITAFEVARVLGAPLDALVVRKLGVPGREELAMGAVASGGILHLNEPVVTELEIPREALEAVIRKERRELDRREEAYRGGRSFPDVAARVVILVDDGIATGSTFIAAAQALRPKGPRRLVAAVPVAPASALAALRPLADEIVCLARPEHFIGVGQFYEDFSAVSDAEVRRLLDAPSATGRRT